MLFFIPIRHKPHSIDYIVDALYISANGNWLQSYYEIQTDDLYLILYFSESYLFFILDFI